MSVAALLLMRNAHLLRAVVLATAGGAMIRGDVLYGLFCALAVGLTLVPAAVERTTAVRPPLGLEVAVLAVMVGDMTIGNLLGLYGKLPWYDKLLHLVASIVVGWIAVLSIHALRATGRVRLHPWLASASVVLVTLGVGAVWEIAEYGVDRALGRATQRAPGMSPHDDTMIDLIVGAIGGVVAAVSGPLYLRYSPRARERVRALGNLLFAPCPTPAGTRGPT